MLSGLAAASAAGALLWMLSREKYIKFDPSEHTLAKLLEILEELRMEYAAVYLNIFTMAKRIAKQKGALSEFHTEELRKRLSDATETAEASLAKKFEITERLLEEWIRHYEAKPEVAAVKGELERNGELVVKGETPKFNFEHNKELSPDRYKKLITTVYKKLRWEVYVRTQKFFAETGNKFLTDEELGDKLEEVKIKDIKEEVYRIMKFTEVPGEKVSHTIMKAYMYIIAELPEETHNQLLDLQLEHKEKLFLIADGKKPADIEDGDPLEVLRKELRDEEEKKARAGEPVDE